jgi:hypothetical protein
MEQIRILLGGGGYTTILEATQIKESEKQGWEKIDVF